MDLYEEIHQAVKDIKRSYGFLDEVVLYINDQCFSEITKSETNIHNIDVISNRMCGYRFFIVSSFHGHKRINAAIY